MDADEITQQIEELETKLERLRSLYEQYFLGIEKVEPMVARKDVDRRIWLLRREQIRNTARRFKLQTIIQRYNTFQQYWQRICREIENGTYKRHLARQRPAGELLTIAAKKRLGKRTMLGEAGPESAPRSGPPSAADSSLETPASVAAPEPSAVFAAMPAEAALKEETPKRPAKPLPPRKETANREAPLAAKEQPPKPLPVTRTGDGVAAQPERLPPQKPGRAPAAAEPAAPVATAALSPAAAPPPKRAVVPPKPPSSEEKVAPSASSSTHLTPDRLRSLHERLVAAKGETQAPSLSSLEKSLRATEAKLQKEHKNRRIDFDVVIKDGRPIIKPIVR